MFLKLIKIIIGLTLICFIIAQEKPLKTSEQLVVYGKEFTFSVTEPQGWHGDIEKAKDFYSNIVFYKLGSDLNKDVIIQLLNFSKQDEKTDLDLEYDIKNYKKKYKSLVLRDLDISHKDYKCFSKLMYEVESFYQYTVYMNPGEKFKSGVSISMNIQKRAATEEELKIFKEIIASIIMIKG